MNRILQTISLVLLIQFTASAQDMSIKKTNRVFLDQGYYDAIKSYEKLPKTEEVLTNLGDAYYFTGDLVKAEQTYTQLSNEFGGIKDRDRVYRFAHALQGSKKYVLADEYLSYYYGSYFNTEKFIMALDASRPHLYEVSELKNPGSVADMGMHFNGKDEVYFASSRNKERPIYNWTNLPYLDLYKGTLKNDNTITDVKLVEGDINQDLHESNAIFTKDGLTMYFNRNAGYRVENEEGKKISVIKLFSANLINGVWSNVRELPFNSETFSTQHPALSTDNKTLYFSSDMQGGSGKFDLYSVTVNGDGTFGNPTSLGKKINSEQNDVFPYISDSGTLYYSSNGLPGFGGLDIYRSDVVNGSFTMPNNLGGDINTAKDEHNIIVDEVNDKGYFTSDRSMIDRLYAFKRKENILSRYLVQGYVKDKNTGKFLAGALVLLMDEQENVLQETIVNETGKYDFRVDKNRKYILRGILKNYEPKQEPFSTNEVGESNKNILLSLESYESLETKIKPNDKGEYLVNLDKIYFDFDKFNIRTDAAKILDELTAIMKKYPDMKIEVSSHTDNYGDISYNLDLSNKRAAATVAYIIKGGIDANRLSSVGYGELKPVIDCDNKKCSETEHDKNRRSEFKIVD